MFYPLFIILAYISSLYVPQAVSHAIFLPYIYRKGGRSGASHTCRTCRGCGIKISYRQLGPGMSQQLQSRCPDCRGEGEVTCSHTVAETFCTVDSCLHCSKLQRPLNCHLNLVLTLTPYPLRSILISSCLRLVLPRGKNA